MLTIYRRHLDKCSKRALGRRWRRCRCPIWVQGTLRGKRVRKSLELISWEAAVAEIREWERDGIGAELVTVEIAVERFLEDCASRNLSRHTVRRYKQELGEFSDWAKKKGIRLLRSVGIDDLREFRASWTQAPLTSVKKLERLRAFLRFCVDSKWIEENGARRLKPPKVKHNPTLPFSDEEMKQILGKAEGKLRTLILLMRYSGMRISDAATLSEDRIRDERVMLYTAKTGTPVSVPLPAFVLEELEKVRDDRYYFWTGGGRRDTCAKNWQRAFRRLFKDLGFPGHSHQLRDTLAVDLLAKGVSVENVAAILGNTPAIVLRHYSPWVQSRQAALDAAMKELW